MKAVAYAIYSPSKEHYMNGGAWWKHSHDLAQAALYTEEIARRECKKIVKDRIRRNKHQVENNGGTADHATDYIVVPVTLSANE